MLRLEPTARDEASPLRPPQLQAALLPAGDAPGHYASSSRGSPAEVVRRRWFRGLGRERTAPRLQSGRSGPGRVTATPDGRVDDGPRSYRRLGGPARRVCSGAGPRRPFRPVRVRAGRLEAVGSILRQVFAAVGGTLSEGRGTGKRS